ncbi:MAG: hypothetical protein AAF587_11150 [Bacteroidota bacterium]
MKSTFFLLLLSLSVLGLTAQSGTSDWPSTILAFDVTTTGVQVTGSLAIERHFHPKPGFHTFIGGGIFAAKDGGLASDEIGPFLEAGFWTGKRNHHFEMRAGITAYDYSSPEFYPVGSIGYRWHNPEKPLIFRIFLGNVTGIGLGLVLGKK